MENELIRMFTVFGPTFVLGFIVVPVLAFFRPYLNWLSARGQGMLGFAVLAIPVVAGTGWAVDVLNDRNPWFTSVICGATFLVGVLAGDKYRRAHRR